MNEFKGINLPPSIFRIIDASSNRAAEGLRVLEDIARMILNDPTLTQEFKTMRHGLEKASNPYRHSLVSWRDSQNDVGQGSSDEISSQHKDISSVVAANARRSEQALRTIEEFARLSDSGLPSRDFEEMRFKLYSLEKTLVARVARDDKRSLIKGLYVILDSTLLGDHNHMEVAEKVLKAGVKIIQLREKNMPSGQMLELACSLRQLCSSHEALLIINDHLDVTLASSAGGLHLGQDDIPLPVARKYLPLDTIIGISVDSVKQAREAEKDGADYIAPQAIFETHSKECPAIGLTAFQAIREAVSIPVVAIGGINIDNIAQVIQSGAESAAVISAVTLSENPAQSARELLKKFNTVFES